MEAGTLHCQSCGAPVGAGDLRCPYCSCQLATLACPKCLGAVSLQDSHCPRCGAEIRRELETPSDLLCPACGTGLFHASVGEAQLDQCHACGGAWVPRPEFEKLAGDREERGGVLGALPGAGPRATVALEEVRYRPCPSCRKLMNRSNYAHTSGVVLDVCKEHGLWFDRDELRQVLVFIEGGGLDQNRARELRQLEEGRSRPAAEGLPPVWVQGPEQPAGSSFLDLVVHGLFGLR